jgi:hypothetical protein
MKTVSSMSKWSDMRSPGEHASESAAGAAGPSVLAVAPARVIAYA